MRFFHGTSDALIIGSYLLPPNTTHILREGFRKKHHDVVFLTTSMRAAEKYARKAVEVYGGNPVVYKATPLGLYTMNNHTECMCDRAMIIDNRNMFRQQ